MKRTALALLSTALMASPAFAIVGGPFDNNVFFGSDTNGTYQGVITGSNLSGIMIFGTTSSSSPSSSTTATDGGSNSGSASVVGVYGNGGRALIFVNGNMVLCDVSAVADFAGRKLTMSIQGSVGFGSTDTKQVQTVQNVSSTSTVTTGSGDSATTTTTTSSTPVVTTTTYVLDGASQVSGILDARFSKTFPQMEYSGNGTLDVLVGTRLAQDVPNESTPYVDVDNQRNAVFVSGVRTSTTNPTIVGTLPWYTTTITTSVATTSAN